MLPDHEDRILRKTGVCTEGGPDQGAFPDLFLALLVYRLLERKLLEEYTCSQILTTLKDMNFARVEDQGYMPLYQREKITDDLHEACGFRTDYQFISKSRMREIEKHSKGRK